jgi:hypothetical protein
MRKVPGVNTHIFKQPDIPWSVGSPLKEVETDLVLDLQTKNTNLMYQEAADHDGVLAAQTPADADAENVGYIYDMGNRAYTWNSTIKPTLNTIDGLSCLDFSGTNKLVLIEDDLTKFGKLTENTSIWTLQFFIKFKVAADGVYQSVFSNRTSGGTTSRLLEVRKTSSNVLNVLMADGSGTFKTNNNTTATITSSDGWTPITIYKNGSGTGSLSIKIGSNAAETSDVNTSGSAGNTATQLGLGSVFSGDLDAYVSNVRLYSRALTDDEISAYSDYTSVRTSNYGDYRLRFDLDFTDSTRMWTDSTRTVNVVDAGLIKYMDGDSRQDLDYNIGRYIDSGGVDTNAPTYDEDGLNGGGVSVWDATRVMTIEEDNGDGMMAERVGTWTMFVVLKNDTAATGSRPFRGDAVLNYLVKTGSAYSGAFDDPYWALHNDPGVIAISPVETTDEWDVVCIRRVVNLFDTWSKTLTKETNANNVGEYNQSSMGDSAVAGWEMNGKIQKVKVFSGALTDNEITTEMKSLAQSI